MELAGLGPYDGRMPGRINWDQWAEGDNSNYIPSSANPAKGGPSGEGNLQQPPIFSMALPDPANNILGTKEMGLGSSAQSTPSSVISPTADAEMARLLAGSNRQSSPAPEAEANQYPGELAKYLGQSADSAAQSKSYAGMGGAVGKGIGAAVGSVIPGVGTAVGAGVGSAVGSIAGMGLDFYIAQEQKEEAGRKERAAALQAQRLQEMQMAAYTRNQREQELRSDWAKDDRAMQKQMQQIQLRNAMEQAFVNALKRRRGQYGINPDQSQNWQMGAK